MIKNYRLVQEDKNTHAFGRCTEKCGLEQQGYAEEEYFFEGTANIYEAGEDGERRTLYQDAPYVNRMIVRRPRESGKFSGRVLVEILNATSGMDIDRMWVLTWRQILRNGDIYIGVTSKPSSVEALKKYDIARYGELSWKNPVKRRLPAFLEQYAAGFGAYTSETEAGLLWDMLEELAQDLKSKAFCPGGMRAQQVYMTGWSQSTGYMIQYVKYFAYHGREHAPFDGYFAGGGVKSLLPGLNQYEMPAIAWDAVMTAVREPFVLLQTESENHALGNETVKTEDSDETGFLHRTYEIPGATHDSDCSMAEWYHGDSDEKRMGIYLTFPGTEAYSNNYPMQFVFHAAYQKLLAWAEEGKIPERYERIHVDMDGRNIRDRFGNARGGWRLPVLDLPVCTYYRYCRDLMPNTSGFALYGCRYPFSAERLKSLYQTIGDYERLVRENTAQAVREGRLLAEDAEECVVFCVREAGNGGLGC
ncbi:MAG: alpha/beta hydrolase domain-containing protein [Eubacteriales bacterium]|nr:alpha/beta hydrolase domain-containing protein [Eubacteriales bacterium]